MSSTDRDQLAGADPSPSGATGCDAGSPAASVVIGLAVAAMGVFLLLSRLDLIDFQISARLLWPFIVLGLGLARMAAPEYVCGRRQSRRSGAWLVWIGLWGMVTEFHVFGLDYGTSWPIMIVGVGLAVIWRALEDRRGYPPVRGS